MTNVEIGIFKNSHFGFGIPFPGTNYSDPATLLKKCPMFKPAPLTGYDTLAHACGVANIPFQNNPKSL